MYAVFVWGKRSNQGKGVPYPPPIPFFFFAMKKVTKTCQLHPSLLFLLFLHSLPAFSLPLIPRHQLVSFCRSWKQMASLFRLPSSLPPSALPSSSSPLHSSAQRPFITFPWLSAPSSTFCILVITTALPSYFFLHLVFVDFLPVPHDRLECRFHVINDPGVADDWRLVNFIASRPIYFFIGLCLAGEKSRSFTLFRTPAAKDAKNPNLAAMNRIEDTRERAARNSQMRKKSSFIPFLLPYLCGRLSEERAVIWEGNHCHARPPLANGPLHGTVGKTVAGCVKRNFGPLCPELN